MTDTQHDAIKPDGSVSIRAGGVRISIPAALVVAVATAAGGGLLGARMAPRDDALTAEALRGVAARVDALTIECRAVNARQEADAQTDHNARVELNARLDGMARRIDAIASSSK